MDTERASCPSGTPKMNLEQRALLKKAQDELDQRRAELHELYQKELYLAARNQDTTMIERKIRYKRIEVARADRRVDDLEATELANRAKSRKDVSNA